VFGVEVQQHKGNPDIAFLSQSRRQKARNKAQIRIVDDDWKLAIT